MIRSLAHRRYVWRLAAAMAAYLATLFLAEWLIEDRGATGPAAFALAMLPGLCVASVFWALGRLLVEETDEFLRSLMVRQMLIASAITLTTTTVYGFLENYGQVPHVEAFWLAILFFFALGIGGLINKVKFGVGPC